MTINNKINILRNINQYSLSEFAALIKISEEELKKIEEGLLEPSLSTLNNISSSLDVPINRLIDETLDLKISNSESDPGKKLAILTSLVFLFPVILIGAMAVLMFYLMIPLFIGMLYALAATSMVSSLGSIILIAFNASNLGAALILAGGSLVCIGLTYPSYLAAKYLTKLFRQVHQWFYQKAKQFSIKELFK